MILGFCSPATFFIVNNQAPLLRGFFLHSKLLMLNYQCFLAIKPYMRKKRIADYTTARIEILLQLIKSNRFEKESGKKN